MDWSWLHIDADVDYASTVTGKKSISGGAVMCAGARVCWLSMIQKHVELSITEANCCTKRLY